MGLVALWGESGKEGGIATPCCLQLLFLGHSFPLQFLLLLPKQNQSLFLLSGRLFISTPLKRGAVQCQATSEEGWWESTEFSLPCNVTVLVLNGDISVEGLFALVGRIW